MDFKCKTYACDELITENNVNGLSTYVAVNCVKSMLRFSRSDFFFNLYDNLFRDLQNKNNYRHTFSDAYDLVMEAYCFFYSHLGERLNGITKILKYGQLKNMTILSACMFMTFQHIRQYFLSYNYKDIDICNKSELPNKGYECSEEEWLKVDEIIEKLNLNKNELKTLDVLLSGKSLSETARIISCGVSTVFDRRVKLQKKYLSLASI